MAVNQHSNEMVTGTVSEQIGQLCRISIAEARRRAFEASEKAQEAQLKYAEEEAKRSYDYQTEE